MQFGYHTDHQQVGYDEDGSPLVQEIHYVAMEENDGRRFAHFFTTTSTEQVERLLSRIEEKVEVLGRAALDLDQYWQEVSPRYGSERHQAIGDWHLMDNDDLEAIANHH